MNTVDPLILRCTQKANKKINGFLNASTESESPFLDWHVNLFQVNRTQYFIYTNTFSFLSFISYGRGISREEGLMRAAHSTIHSGLKSYDLDFFYFRHIGPTLGHTVFTKTNNRQVLGSMNDLISGTKWLIKNRNCDLLSVARELNEIPLKACRPKRQIDLFRELTF